jgi:hypothetical protein
MIEKIIEDLRKVINFKDTAVEGDIVLVVIEKPQAIFYAMLTDIERDMNKKDEWWHVTLMALASVPPQKIVWTLRTPQLSGQEIFTMGGEKHFIKAVDFQLSGPGPDVQPIKKEKKRPALRVVK